LIKHMISVSNRDVKNQAADANIVTLVTEDAN